jgi:DHA1 family quinolone resistance protein-like MFS transporter
MLTKLTSFFDSKEIPPGIRLLTTVTSIRWFGWGFAESLIPVLLFSFGNSFAEAGLIKASVDITFVLALPIIGMFADKVRATTLIVISIFLYLFVGFGYFLAGVTGMVAFVVLARLVNGVTWGLDVVGRETYFRRHVSKDRTATAFGYFDTVANFWWMVSAVLGIFLIKYFSITELLFLITPFSFIALLVLSNFRKTEEKMDAVKTQRFSFNFLKEIKDWELVLKGILGFSFLISFTASVVVFFLPIELYKEGGSLTLVILMGIVYALPALTGWSLGKLFDTKGYGTLGTGLLFFALLLLSLSFLTSFFWRIIIMFLISVVLELISVGSNELISATSKPEHFGRVEGVMRSITNIGDMMGPLVAGILIDLTSTGSTYISLAVLIFSLAIIFKVLDRKGFLEKYAVSKR